THLRAVLHHERERTRNRSWAIDGLRHREAEWRQCVGSQPTAQRLDLQSFSAADRREQRRAAEEHHRDGSTAWLGNDSRRRRRRTRSWTYAAGAGAGWLPRAGRSRRRRSDSPLSRTTWTNRPVTD